MKGMGHVQQIELLHGFNDMTAQLKTFLVFLLFLFPLKKFICSQTFQLTSTLRSLHLGIADSVDVILMSL